MINWLSNYTFSWRLVSVNPYTWANDEIIPDTISMSVTRDCTDSASLLESGSIELDSYDEFEPGWYRVEGLFIQETGVERHPIATMYCESFSEDYGKYEVQSGIMRTSKVDCYSVLKPAEGRHFLTGAYIPKGTNGANQIARYLRACTPAPVVVEGDGFVLDDDLVFDADETYIGAIWKILDAAGWCMQIFGDGTIYVMRKPTEPDLIMDRVTAAILEPGTSKNTEHDDIYNVYIAVHKSGDLVTITNEDPRSPISTVTLGRVSEFVDRSPVLVDGESLASYAKRKLEEKSTVIRKYQYKREWYPDIYPYSVIRGVLATSGLTEDMRVLSQSFSLGNGITVSETSGVLVKEYTP